MVRYSYPQCLPARSSQVQGTPKDVSKKGNGRKGSCRKKKIEIHQVRGGKQEHVCSQRVKEEESIMSMQESMRGKGRGACEQEGQVTRLRPAYCLNRASIASTSAGPSLRPPLPPLPPSLIVSLFPLSHCFPFLTSTALKVQYHYFSVPLTPPSSPWFASCWMETPISAVKNPPTEVRRGYRDTTPQSHCYSVPQPLRTILPFLTMIRVVLDGDADLSRKEPHQ